MKNIYPLFILIVFFAFRSVTVGQTQKENPQQSQGEQQSHVIYPSHVGLSRPVTELSENPIQKTWVSPDRKNRPYQTFIYSAADGPEYGNDSSIIQTKMGKRDATQTDKAILQNWAGVTGSGYPPDPTGAAGPNHYIQGVNATTIRIWNKTGTQLASFSLGTLWSTSVNAGDPIVMYDKFADRWFLAQFDDPDGSTPNNIHIAISKTNDPTGQYYTYTYTSPDFPDYLKFSIWHDGYYMTSNQSNQILYVFERSQMLTGATGARALYEPFDPIYSSSFYVPLPGDAADNDALPAAGTPLPFFSYHDNAWGGGADGIKIWNASTDWTAETITITGPTLVTTNAFDASYNSTWNDVPQPNGQYLDGIGGVLMFRAPWRSWSGYNNVVLSWGVLIANSPRQRAIFWCELRQTSGTWSVYQQGIYAPDTDTRWMSSATMDDNGSIALCFAKSSATAGDYPSLYYTGRLAGDALGTMTFTETLAAAGTASQTTYNRFGDYSHTSLDPDGITFWHTGEYVTSTSSRQTRVYSFQLPAGPLAPVANFVADATAPFCTGTVQFTDQSTNTPTSWLWNFGDGQTSTLQSPSHTYAASGTYTVSLKATNAIGNNTMTKTSYITISLPSNATATGAARCGTGTVTLTATGANTLKWYDAATGGNLLGTGTSFTTPSISTTTTYYVENNIPSSPANVGPAVGGASRNIAAILYFDVYQPMTLISVQARAQTTGVKTITLLDNTGATVYTANVTVNNSVTTITLNWVIQPGSGYQLLTLENSALYRISSGVSYPYTAPGLCSITGCDIGSAYYYSWFNWNVQGLGCGSTRVPAVATINPTVTPSVAVTPSATNICSGTGVTFTATPSNGGTPSYQWKVNGNNVGSNSPTFTSSALSDGDVITCTMTSTESCASPATATSSGITMTVNPVVTPSVAVSASATTICAGTSVSFTATPTNGGTPTYQWKRNGSNVGTGSTYTNTGLANGDIITCVMTSTATCASPTTATSTPVTMSVSTPVTPSVAVSASATSICSGTSVTFTAVPTNGGTPSYQWKLNGANVGTGGTTYTNAALANGDAITCVMTSTATCATPTTATSTPVTMTVNTTVTPSVAVSATATSICSGTSVTFTATPTNGGSPSYQWKRNGSNVGTGSTYTSTGLANGDIITCVMTSTATCASPTTATSAPISMSVSTPVTPSVAVAASATSICSGTSVTFTATPTNGGAPTYQWLLNGSNVGTGGTTYTNAALTNGDIVTCVMTSTATCASPTTATSTPVTMTVNTTVTPSVAVAASATTICSGTSVTFTATPTNGGTPTYQWKLNGTNVGTGGTTYTNAALANGDIVTCVMTSTATCASPATATSAPVTITVSTTVVPAVSVAASATTICSGTSVTFTATPTNGGTPAYQWLLNGGNVGGNNAIYTNAGLANGDVITCVMTSTESCASPTTATSSPVTMTVSSTLTPAVSVAASATNICSGTNVTFTATPTNGGTPSYQWQLNGGNVGGNSATYTNAALNSGDIITCVMTSSESCASPTTAISTPVAMTVSTSVTPSVVVNASATSICSGTSVTFTAAPVNGGAPTYHWKLNGSDVGTNSATYTNASLNNGDVIICEMTSSETCASPTNATSTPIEMTVSTSVTPSVAVSASATTICTGTSVTFTATPTNGGTPSYQWKLNGSDVGSNNANYTNSSLNNGDVITCVMTSTATCASPATATSTPVTMTVSTSVVPSVAVSATSTNICSGTSVTFTASPNNGGTPSYQWLLNGTNVGTNSPTYTNAALNNGDAVSCIMTSSITCASPTTAVATPVNITVSGTLTPSVSIAATATSICSGTPVLFTATPVNGGTPTYQWKLNGTNVGTNSATYNNSSLINGDVVTCEMTSSESCASPASVSSGIITMTVSTSVTPAVSIAASTNSICYGTPVTFTATPVNGGTPSYQWTLNGTNVGSNSPNYTSSMLQNGDVVACTMISTVSCASASTASSNTVSMIVNPSVTPSVSIASSANSVCEGTAITFTATPVNGGSPSYQWLVNGANVGSNLSTFTSTTLSDGDIVSCVISSNAPCVSPLMATSNTIAMDLYPNLTPSVAIASQPAGTVCPGTAKEFTAVATNGGTAPTFEWFVDGVSVGTGSTLNGTYSNGQVITCTMTSTQPCVMPAIVDANPITVSTFTVTPVTISDNGGTLTSSATYGNQWYEVNSGIVVGAIGQSFTPLTDGVYYVIVTDANGCTATSNQIEFILEGIDENGAATVTFFPNPTSGNLTVTFNKAFNNGTLKVENAIGELVFEKSINQATGSVFTVDFSTYAPGSYFITVKDAENEIREQVIYEK